MPWIKVVTNISDKTGCSTFISFERKILPMVGKTAQYFREKQIKVMIETFKP